MAKLIRVLLFVSLLASACGAPGEDYFWEELLLKPLHGDQLYAHFQFTTVWDVDSDSHDLFQTNLFSRALSEVIARHNVQELHVSLTAGLWQYENWGYPVVDAAPGAEAWAWFKSDTGDVDGNWRQLTNALSGLLCASLNTIDVTNSISPDISFRPRGVTKEPIANSSYLRYASLPREIVCTENLTPWKKLLPCDSKLGLATLLNAGYIHATRYHSIGIHLRPICRDAACDLTSIELQQSVDLVYDHIILGTRNWSLRKLFGQGIMNSCPLARTSAIYVDVSGGAFELSPPPDEYVTSARGGAVSKLAKYNVGRSPTSIGATYVSGGGGVQEKIAPPLHANQYKTGYGQQKGGLLIKLYNGHWGALDVVVLQNVPWFVPIYLHTLRIESSNGGDETLLAPTLLRYKPGKLRERAHGLEIGLRLPAKSTTSVRINFDYVFLKWQEYPPDANHGFYVGSAVVSALLPVARGHTGIPQDGSLLIDGVNASSRGGYLVQVRTESIVITLPTPDFSMPYNVICLACTVVALAFGPLHNITTKRLILRANRENLVAKARAFVTKFFVGSKRADGEGVEEKTSE